MPTYPARWLLLSCSQPPPCSPPRAVAGGMEFLHLLKIAPLLDTKDWEGKEPGAARRTPLRRACSLSAEAAGARAASR